MKTKTIALTSLGLVAVLLVWAYATGNLNSLQGRFKTSGSAITVDVASDTPRSDIIVSGDTDVPFSTYRFTSVGEAMVVDSLTIKAMGSTTAVSEVTISYEDSSGVTATNKGTMSAGKVTFSGLDLYIAKDDSADLTVYGDVNPIGSGASSGDKVQLVFAKDAFNAVAQDTLKTYSSMKYTATTMPNKMYIYATKPTISLDPSSPASGAHTADPMDDIFYFDIAADVLGDVTMKTLKITLNSDADFDTAATVSAKIVDPDTGTVLLAPVNVSFSSSSIATLTWTDTVTIPAATTRRFDLIMDTESLLDEDEGIDDPLTLSINLGTAGSAGGIIWNDGLKNVTWFGNLSSTTLMSNTVQF